MVEPALLDVYEAAYLAGGVGRAVDTAVVALVETGRVRAQRSGALSVVEDRPRHDVEAAVLEAIRPADGPTVGVVRARVSADPRVTAIADRLTRDGLVASSGLAELAGQWRWHWRLTSAGRLVLAELRASPPEQGVAQGTNAGRVAVGGPAQMPDPALRKALFHPSRTRAARRRTWGCGGYGGGYGGGGDGGGGCGGGGGGCGGGGG